MKKLIIKERVHFYLGLSILLEEEIYETSIGQNRRIAC